MGAVTFEQRFIPPPALIVEVVMVVVAVDVVAVVRDGNGLGPSPGCGVTASTIE